MKNRTTAFKVEIAVKVQDVSECPDDIFSVCPIVSAQFLHNCSTISFFFFTKLGRVVYYYHEAMCHVEKVVHYLQGQGNSKSLCNQSMTIFTISSKLLVYL